MRQRTGMTGPDGTRRGRSGASHRRTSLLGATFLVVVALASPGHAVTFTHGTFESSSPTMILRDGSGVALGTPAPVTELSAAPSYAFEIDTVPPSLFRVDGAAHPIFIAFGDFTGSWLGGNVSVQDLEVMLMIGGGSVLGYRPTTDGSWHFPIAWEQSSLVILGGTLTTPLGSLVSANLTRRALLPTGPGPEVIVRRDQEGNTFDVFLAVGPLGVELGRPEFGLGLTLELSSVGAFFCMDCGFDLPSGPFPPTIPEPAPGVGIAVGLALLALHRRRG